MTTPALRDQFGRSIEYLRIPDLRIVPGLCIASPRRVRSVVILSKVPPEHIRSLALDTSSRTSVVRRPAGFSPGESLTSQAGSGRKPMSTARPNPNTGVRSCSDNASFDKLV